MSDDLEELFTVVDDKTQAVKGILQIHNKTHELYFSGRKVVTQSGISLTWAQKLGALLVALSAVAAGFYSILQIIDWFQYGAAAQQLCRSIFRS
ncbi:MAG: hypothetical protein E6Q98_15950 [Rhodospirillaceae bacterium]|nr:MAG: hypothetical protein E6Q98_15950 [Rhodospirillaceae bacterium]